jgi:hypothetical protein
MLRNGHAGKHVKTATAAGDKNAFCLFESAKKRDHISNNPIRGSGVRARDKRTALAADQR